MMKQKSDNFDFFCETIDLSLMALQALDKYSYDSFFEKLSVEFFDTVSKFFFIYFPIKNRVLRPILSKIK